MPKTAKTRKKHEFRKAGPFTNAEKDLVTHFLADQTKEVTQIQVTALSKVLRRTPEAVRSLLQEAKDRFVESAGDYVSMHKLATQGALAEGEWADAAKAAQWAISNISAEGERIVEKETVQQTMPRVIVGVRIGGLDLEEIQASDGVIVDNESR